MGHHQSNYLHCVNQDRTGTAGVLACLLAHKLLSLLYALVPILVGWDGGRRPRLPAYPEAAQLAIRVVSDLG